MRSPKARAEEEPRRRGGLGREAREAERAGGEGEAARAYSRRKGTRGMRDRGEGSSAPPEAKGRTSGWGGAGQTRRAGPPSLPQRRGVQGILPASLRPAAGPARRVTRSSGGWRGRAAREGGGGAGSGRDGAAEAPGAASSRGFLPSPAELQNGGRAGPRERSETPPRARAMAAAAARGRARLRGRAGAAGPCSGPGLGSGAAGEPPRPHCPARVTQPSPAHPRSVR